MKANTVHDINQFPKEAGMLIFGISMSRISTAQNPQQCFDWMKFLAGKIVQTEGVGMTLLYTDSLYMHSDESAEECRRKYLGAMTTHANGFRKILSKNIAFIPQAFTYLTWSQLLLHAKDFLLLMGKFQKLYEQDDLLKKCVEKDAKKRAKLLTDHHIRFILEESLALHLIAKGVVHIPNEFIHGKEEWILHCYPGKPLLTEAYLVQKNPFKLKNPENKYEHASYDLEEKKLYDLGEVPLPR